MYDLTNLRTLAVDNSETIVLVIDRFLKSAPEVITRLQTETEENNWDAVRETAHKMISSSGMLGISHLSQIFRTIEQNALNRKDTGSIPGYINQAEEMIQKVSPELEKEKTKLIE